MINSRGLVETENIKYEFDDFTYPIDYTYSSSTRLIRAMPACFATHEGAAWRQPLSRQPFQNNENIISVQ